MTSEEEGERKGERETHAPHTQNTLHVYREQGLRGERGADREAQGWAHAKTIDSTRLHAGNSILKAAATCPFSA